MPQRLPTFPLEVFQFNDRPQPLQGRFVGPTWRNDLPLTWSVRQDGRDIPFKFLRAQDLLPTDTASRPILVLLHGMGITTASFAGIAPYLFDSHDLLLIDYNSFSVPERWPAGGVSLRLLAAGAWRIIEALALPQINLLGSSLGGGLALLMASMAPHRVQAIGLLNPAVYPQKLPRMYRLLRIPIIGELLMAFTPAEKLVEGVAYIGYTAPEKMPDSLRQCYVANLRTYHCRLQLMDVIRQLPANARALSELDAELKRIMHPTLILWGMQERLLLPDTPERLLRDLPNARLLEFADLAHLPHDEAPDRLGPILAEFFRPASVSSSSPPGPSLTLNRKRQYA